MGKVKELLMEMEEHGYEILTKGEKYVCPYHFEDNYLNQYIEKHGETGCVHIVDVKGQSLI